ncbi:DUF1294 domain-containing protein [uncultured Tyzzerella sp.]|uniref:DUF1294 domain-containing protein n=1 Tax=uncultured Tyzzerella sp. TaxID=2321398 RepID=UPI0029420709|nr:DUF1294 domain-containing protein [uncultured Tyzzerella sp.]
MYYILINFITFNLIWIDKQKAIKHKWRIRETTLFTFFIIGGFLGGFFSMKIFNHKTKKFKFYFMFFISTIIHIFIVFILYKERFL